MRAWQALGSGSQRRLGGLVALTALRSTVNAFLFCRWQRLLDASGHAALPYVSQSFPQNRAKVNTATSSCWVLAGRNYYMLRIYLRDKYTTRK